VPQTLWNALSNHPSSILDADSISMPRFLKYAMGLLGILVTAFWLLTTFSTIETPYECNGELTFKGKAQPDTLYIKLEEYRWWIVWGDSDASLLVEYPNECAGSA
jgi:hypothetical protein